MLPRPVGPSQPVPAVHSTDGLHVPFDPEVTSKYGVPAAQAYLPASVVASYRPGSCTGPRRAVRPGSCRRTPSTPFVGTGRSCRSRGPSSGPRRPRGPRSPSCRRTDCREWSATRARRCTRNTRFPAPPTRSRRSGRRCRRRESRATDADDVRGRRREEDAEAAVTGRSGDGEALLGRVVIGRGEAGRVVARHAVAVRDGTDVGGVRRRGHRGREVQDRGRV